MRSQDAAPNSLASSQLPLLLALPIPLAAIVMQQIARADRLFPVERRDLDGLLKSLQTPRSDQMEKAVQSFASLRLSKELLRVDWRRDATDFVAKMTAELWASNQINTFREAAKGLVPATSAIEDERERAEPRSVVVVLDKDLRTSSEPSALFNKLRPYGTFFPVASDAHGGEAISKWVAERTGRSEAAYAHWHLSGGSFNQELPANIVALSYDGLHATRTKVLTMFRDARQRSSGGMEDLRQALLYVRPEEMGLGLMKDAVLQTFVLDLFSGGSGTQLYATTFVQWAMREALRRAQPQTVVARFTARSTATSMDERFSHPEVDPAPDYEGSLVDAEMGAYMSYLNLQRLPGSRTSSFLAWHEGYGQAVLMGPAMPAGTVSEPPIQMSQMLSLMSERGKRGTA